MEENMYKQLIQPHNDLKGKFLTTILFWDCSCETMYIHPITVDQCPVCQAHRKDSPDARLDEILRYAEPWDLGTMLVIDFLREIAPVDVIPFCDPPPQAPDAWLEAAYEEQFELGCDF